MDVKLTVRVPQELLSSAERYAQRAGTTVPCLIAAFLQQIPVEEPDLDNAPLVRALAGVVAPDLAIADYREPLCEKYDTAWEPG